MTRGGAGRSMVSIHSWFLNKRYYNDKDQFWGIQMPGRDLRVPDIGKPFPICIKEREKETKEEKEEKKEKEKKKKKKKTHKLSHHYQVHTGSRHRMTVQQKNNQLPPLSSYPRCVHHSQPIASSSQWVLLFVSC